MVSYKFSDLHGSCRSADHNNLWELFNANNSSANLHKLGHAFNKAFNYNARTWIDTANSRYTTPVVRAMLNDNKPKNDTTDYSKAMLSMEIDSKVCFRVCIPSSKLMNNNVLIDEQEKQVCATSIPLSCYVAQSFINPDQEVEYIVARARTKYREFIAKEREQLTGVSASSNITFSGRSILKDALSTCNTIL
jgi:hypothetical protein